MKLIKYITFFLLVLNSMSVFAQAEFVPKSGKNFPMRLLTIEPGIGLNPMPISDLVVSNVLQWNISKRFSAISYTSYAYNNVFLRKFNFITTDYNYSLNQKFGVGVSIYSKHSMHTFSLLAGIKYDSYQETLDNPDIEKVSMSVKSLSPDAGLMYNLKKGRKKYFFSFRMYIPLYPYPIANSSEWSLDGNMANVTLEFGVGIRLK
ncbi:MAG: hypothetical protein ABIP35_17080 [Ginsengibacter sp.]